MLIILPQSLSSIYTHPQNYLIVLYTIICIFSALVLNIVLKYASYTPIYHASGISNISGILTLIMLIPGGVLITIGYSIWKYIIAEKISDYYMLNINGLHFTFGQKPYLQTLVCLFLQVRLQESLVKTEWEKPHYSE